MNLGGSVARAAALAIVGNRVFGHPVMRFGLVANMHDRFGVVTDELVVQLCSSGVVSCEDLKLLVDVPFVVICFKHVFFARSGKLSPPTYIIGNVKGRKLSQL